MASDAVDAPTQFCCSQCYYAGVDRHSGYLCDSVFCGVDDCYCDAVVCHFCSGLYRTWGIAFYCGLVCIYSGSGVESAVQQHDVSSGAGSRRGVVRLEEQYSLMLLLHGAEFAGERLLYSGMAPAWYCVIDDSAEAASIEKSRMAVSKDGHAAFFNVQSKIFTWEQE